MHVMGLIDIYSHVYYYTLILYFYYTDYTVSTIW